MSGTTITRLVLVQTGTYDDMVCRPYTSTLNGSLLNQIQEATQFGSRHNPASIAGIAGQILTPSTHGKVVSIANGWDTARFRFMMEAISEQYQGGAIVQYICGYTNHVGISRGMHLDPNMEFYINSVVTTRRMAISGPMGMGYKQFVSSADHLLMPSADWTGHGYNGFNNFANKPHLMRPEDVFYTMGLSVLGENLANVHDVRTNHFLKDPKKSRRSNNLAPQYLSKVMDVHQKAMLKSQHNGITDNLADIMDDAAGMVTEEIVAKDMFLSTLFQQTNFVEGQCVSYRELQRLAPNLDNQTTVVTPGQMGGNDAHIRGTTERWVGTTNETMAATILSHAVPAIMMDLMLTKIAFSATNRTLGGQPQCLISDVKSFAGGDLDLTQYVQLFQTRFLTEVFSDISRNGAMDLEVHVIFDVLGETNIQISIQGGPWTPYTAASFCDALYTPVWGENADSLRSLAFDLGNLCDNLEVHHRQSFNAQQYAPTEPGGYSSQQTPYGMGPSSAIIPQEI